MPSRSLARAASGRVSPADEGGGDVFRALADPTRRALLDRLRSGPAPVNELALDFDQSRPAISKHLRILREARLVDEHRSGRERLYRLEPAPLREVAGWLDHYRRFWLDGLNNLKHLLESENAPHVPAHTASPTEVGPRHRGRR